MAVVGTVVFYQDDPTGLAVGAARGWKIGFGYSAKGTVVQVYVVSDLTGGVTNTNSEIPKLANGKVDVNAVTSFLSGFGVSLTNSLKQVIGA